MANIALLHTINGYLIFIGINWKYKSCGYAGKIDWRGVNTWNLKYRTFKVWKAKE
jgi:hypothetical protein